MGKPTKIAFLTESPVRRQVNGMSALAFDANTKFSNLPFAASAAAVSTEMSFPS